MQSLKDYLNDKSFPEGLPQGDTYIKIDDTSVEETPFTDDSGKETTRARILLADGRIFYISDGVLREINKAMKAGKSEVRITRSGQGMQTKYTVVATK